MPRLFARKSAPALRLVPAPAVGRPASGVEQSATIRLAERSSQIRVTCRSGHLHAHWQCECGATGISSPYASIETAMEAAHAAAHKHHAHRHTAPTRTLAIA